jgi:signal transduction histidine kinase
MRSGAVRHRAPLRAARRRRCRSARPVQRPNSSRASARTICDYVTVAYERVRLVKQLQDSDRRKDEFLAVLAHELRNPLAPIRNSLQLLRMGNGNGEIIEQARRVMERQLEHMVH